VDFERLFNQKIEENYWDIVNNISSYLMKNNEEYRNNSHCIVNILNDSENLRMVLEDNISVDLTKEEVSKLIEYISKSLEMRVMEKKYIFYTGCRFTYFFIKKMDLLKETNTDLSSIQ